MGDSDDPPQVARMFVLWGRRCGRRLVTAVMVNWCDKNRRDFCAWRRSSFDDEDPRDGGASMAARVIRMIPFKLHGCVTTGEEDMVNAMLGDCGRVSVFVHDS